MTDLSPVTGLIEAALKHDPLEHSLLQVVERVRNGEYLAVELGPWAVLILEILPLADDRKALSVVLAAGIALQNWVEAGREFLITLARDQGCQRILVTGRKGWPRVLVKLGFIHRQSTLTLEVA